VEHKPIIVIPQLWLWRFGNVVISAHESDRLSEPFTNDNFVAQLHQVDPEVQLGLILARYIRAFGDDIWVKGNNESIKHVDPPLARFENRVVSILTDVKKYIQDTNRSRIRYDKEAGFHHVLSDCRSELAMLDYVLTQQEEILTSLLQDCKVSTEEWGTVFEARTTLARYRRAVQKIDGDAERIEKNVNDLLNLKRTYASVQDSHTSVLLSVAAIGFAIVTIIFAPLAFLVGLFALDFRSFDRLRVKGTTETDELGPSKSFDMQNNTAIASSPAYDGGKMAGIFGTQNIP
jgi:hypothetical protein